MRHAYTIDQTTLSAHMPGQLCPSAIVSGAGQTMLMTESSSDKIVDLALRAACSEMGSRVGMASKPTRGEIVQKLSIRNTISLAWRIGRAILKCQRNTEISLVADRIIEEVGGPRTARKLFAGKIVQVDSHLHKGHTYGNLKIDALSATELAEESSKGVLPYMKSDGCLRIPFKNENILAEWESISGEREIIAVVPDLICVLDATSGESLGVPEFRYGLRVVVIGITCSPLWTSTPEALKLGGPAAFGYDVPYKPLGVYVEPRSIIEEYSV